MPFCLYSLRVSLSPELEHSSSSPAILVLEEPLQGREEQPVPALEADV